MNETINNIENRRTTRVFLPEQIKEEELKAIIDAGLSAPSAHNDQSWHFTVIQNKEILDQLNNEFKEVAKNVNEEFVQQLASNEKFHVFYNAPTVIIVSGDENGAMPQEDCAAATQNMLIAAESLGIGSCWIGIVSYLFRSDKGEEYKNKFEIPDTHQLYYVVALGYKKSERKAPAKKENTVKYIK